MRRLRQWALPLIWAIVIWTFSTGSFSAQDTSRWILPVLHWLLPHARQRTLLLLHTGIRKLAHVFEYMIFSLVLLRGIRGDRKGWKLDWAFAAVAIAVGYAALDELHQVFVPGRGPALRDVLIDAAGVALGQVLAWLWSRHAGEKALAPEP
jgi:VanZ family protein